MQLLIASVCLPFIVSGTAKLTNLSAAQAEFSGLGLPAPALMVAATIAVQLGGSAMAVLGRGRAAALGAAALAAFTMLATLIAHAFWRFEGPARSQQTNVFLEHVSIVFGLLLISWLHARAPRQAAQTIDGVDAGAVVDRRPTP